MTNIISKSRKILLTILVIQVIFAIVNVSKAFSISDIISGADEFLATGKYVAGDYDSADEVKDTINSIYSIIFPLGVVITVIVGGILGIKFMVSSIEGKAKIKEMLIPYAIGCVVIYGALGIWKLVLELNESIMETGEEYITKAEYYRKDGYETTDEMRIAMEYIEQAKVDVRNLSDEQIKDLYGYLKIGDDLHAWTTSDPRAPEGKDPALTLEESIKKLSSDKRKIYDEAKRRGLLKLDDPRYLKSN